METIIKTKKTFTKEDVIKAASQKYDLSTMNPIEVANMGDIILTFGKIVGFNEKTTSYIFEDGKERGVLRVSNKIIYEKMMRDRI